MAEAVKVEAADLAVEEAAIQPLLQAAVQAEALAVKTAIGRVSITRIVISMPFLLTRLAQRCNHHGCDIARAARNIAILGRLKCKHIR